MTMRDNKSKHYNATHGMSKSAEFRSRAHIEAQALEIRNANGFHHVIAAAFGVSRRTVGLIKRGVTWSHL